MQRKNSIRYQKLHIMLVQHKEQEWQLQVKKKRKIRFLGEKREKDLLRIGLLCGRGEEAKASYSMATVVWKAAWIAFQNLRCRAMFTNLRDSNSLREYFLFPILFEGFDFLWLWPLLLFLVLLEPPFFFATESSNAVSSITSIPKPKEEEEEEDACAVTDFSPPSADSSSTNSRFFFISSSAESRTGCSWESETSAIAKHTLHFKFCSSVSLCRVRLRPHLLYAYFYSHDFSIFTSVSEKLFLLSAQQEIFNFHLYFSMCTNT